MRALIINIDDFGETPGINRAALEILQGGFVRSVSASVTGRLAGEAANLAPNYPHVSVGIHFNLSEGSPLCGPKAVPSLVRGNGEFYGNEFSSRSRRGLFDIEEMKCELATQVDRLRDMGIQITHWDSHQARHMYPGFFEAALAVAKEKGIPASRTHKYYLLMKLRPRLLALTAYYARHPRFIVTHALAAYRSRVVAQSGIRLPDRRLVMSSLGPDAAYRKDCWQHLLKEMPEGVNFVECHPAYLDEELCRYSPTLAEPREKERQLLSDPDWLRRAEELGVMIVDFRWLTARPVMQEL